MKTLAQEIGALVAGMTCLEHETAEQFEERIGRMVLERLRDSYEPAPWVVTVQDDDAQVLGCYGPFVSREEAFEFKKTVYGKRSCEIFPLRRREASLTDWGFTPVQRPRDERLEAAAALGRTTRWMLRQDARECGLTQFAVLCDGPVEDLSVLDPGEAEYIAERKKSAP